MNSSQTNSGPFKCIVADPPWPIRWSGGAAWRTNGRGERHLNKRFKKPLDYPTMPVSDICALNVGALASADSVLWLWITDRFALWPKRARRARTSNSSRETAAPVGTRGATRSSVR